MQVEAKQKFEEEEFSANSLKDSIVIDCTAVWSSSILQSNENTMETQDKESTAMQPEEKSIVNTRYKLRIQKLEADQSAQKYQREKAKK